MEIAKHNGQQLSRAQRRAMERIDSEVKDVFTRLSNQFFNFLMDSDNPSEEELRSKLKEVNSKWIVSCRRLNVKEEFHKMLNQQCDAMISDYLTTKNGNSPSDQPEPTPTA
jgi:hypothetical protein